MAPKGCRFEPCGSLLGNLFLVDFVTLHCNLTRRVLTLAAIFGYPSFPPLLPCQNEVLLRRLRALSSKGRALARQHQERSRLPFRRRTMNGSKH